MFSFKATLCLAGALLVPCLCNVSALRPLSWAQEATETIPQNATETQVKERWSGLQKELAELEATDPRAAATRYQRFFEAGAFRFPAVGLHISLRIARIWQLDLNDPDKALEIYDWALAHYKDQPDALLLQQGRLAAEQAQKRAEAARANNGPLAATVPLAPPLTVGAAPAPNGGKLGVHLPAPSGGAGLGVGLAVTPANGGLGVGLGAPIGGTLGVSPLAGGGIRPIGVAIAQSSAPGTAYGWKPGPTRCVTALAQGADGALWVATEESGVWRYDATAANAGKSWTQFTAKDGLGDESAYALAIDAKGRVWAGTRNHGVAVWNGAAWKNFGVLNGPLGERVFAIATCPTDGDVWIATNLGLARYSMKRDSWSYFTRVEGLPSDQIAAMAFAKNGDIVIGTQCEGIALASAADNYKSWRITQGPREMPLAASGNGLPGNLINDVLVARDGAIYVATTTGLAWSRDGGQNWKYVRGRDYAEKVRGLYGGAPANWKEQAGAILAEDYVSCLAEDEKGRLWIGHRQAGNEILEARQGSVAELRKVAAGLESSDLVRAILPRRGAPTLLARYDNGISLSTLNFSNGALPASDENKGAIPLANFPSPAQTTTEQLRQLVAQTAVQNRALKVGEGAFWDEDWSTQGDWVGRYGRQRAILCAAQSPMDNNFGFDPAYLAQGFIGPHAHPGDSLRNWVHWVMTDNPNSLYNPVEGYRRQAEWDDHGEVYPTTFEGPDIWIKATVPAGLHRLSLYFFNKDGESDLNRMRDYLLELKQGEARNTTEAHALPTQARARVRDFRGGVYKRFAVRGPGDFWLRIGKNNSWNTIVSAVCLDKIVAEPTIYDDLPLPWMSHVRYQVPPAPALQENENARIAVARQIWESLPAASGDQRGLAGVPRARLLALRAVSAEVRDAEGRDDQAPPEHARSASSELLKRWRWMATHWSADDRHEWAAAMQQGYRAAHAPHEDTARDPAEEQTRLRPIRQQIGTEGGGEGRVPPALAAG